MTGSVARAALALAVVVAACTATDPAVRVPQPLAGWPVRQVHLDDRPLTVAIAQDHVQGLRGVEDLGNLDGLLFDYGAEVDPSAHGFWMDGVAMPLDIAWFAADGRLVGTASMPLCVRPCPLHHAPAPFRWALETPAGSLGLAPDVRLEGARVTRRGARGPTSFVPGVVR